MCSEVTVNSPKDDSSALLSTFHDDDFCEARLPMHRISVSVCICVGVRTARMSQNTCRNFAISVHVA